MKSNIFPFFFVASRIKLPPWNKLMPLNSHCHAKAPFWIYSLQSMLWAALNWTWTFHCWEVKFTVHWLVPAKLRVKHQKWKNKKRRRRRLAVPSDESNTIADSSMLYKVSAVAVDPTPTAHKFNEIRNWNIRKHPFLNEKHLCAFNKHPLLLETACFSICIAFVLCFFIWKESFCHS